MTHSNAHQIAIDAFREQILNAAKSNIQLSIEGGGTKSWYGNPNQFTKLSTQTYSGILEYQPEELVITACAGTPLKEIEAALQEKTRCLLLSPHILGSRQRLVAQLPQDLLVLGVLVWATFVTLY